MENNTSFPSLENFNKSKKLTLEEFNKQTKRKLTIHLLSDDSSKCIKFIEFFTKEKIENSKDLLEINIKKKVNLYSFMNYKTYEDASKLMEVIEKKVEFVFNNSKPDTDNTDDFFSEVLIILDNDEIKNQIDIIGNKFKENNYMLTNSYLNPFLIIVSPEEIELSDFIKSKTFQFKMTLKDIFSFNIDIKGDKNLEVLGFLRKLNVFFSYYNELGDEFSFIN